MEDLKEYLNDRLSGIEEIYNYYIEKLEKTYKPDEISELVTRIRDLRIEKTTIEDIIEKIGDDNENMVSNKKQ